MIKKCLLGLSLVFVQQIACAMPCDNGYVCLSQSGKYAVVVGNCSDQNNLSLKKVTINNKTITAATLGPAYDGTTGENGNASATLAFQVNLPNHPADTADFRRILTIEVPAQNLKDPLGARKGVIRELFSDYNPGAFKLVKKESAICKIDG